MTDTDSNRDNGGDDLTAKRRSELMDEYKEAGHYHRLHITLLFGQLTVYLGISGAMINFMSKDPKLQGLALVVLALSGCLISLVFFIHHERVYESSHRSRGRAEEIQKLLGLRLYRSEHSLFDLDQLLPAKGRWKEFIIERSRINSIARRSNKLRAAPANRILYFSGFLFWFVVAVRDIVHLLFT